jgi:type VI secretion system secreted protein VgrG
MAITQANRLLSLSSPLPYDQLVVRRLSAEEGISRLFQIDLELLHEEVREDGPPFTIDPKKLVGQPMSVEVVQEEGSTEVTRHFHGICISFAQGNRTSRWTKYHAVVVPRVWLLTQIKRSRIFQQKNVEEILKTVLNGFDVNWELNGFYEPRNYCVQYRESDWDFASRLMEDEGIFYFFEHTENGHKMTLANTPPSHKLCPTKNKIEFAVDRSSEKTEWASSILTWRVDDRVRTGKYTLWDHTFELPGKALEAAQVSLFDIGGNNQLEFYDYPGGYAKRFDGIDTGGGERSSDVQKIFNDNKRTVKLRQQEIDVNYKNFFGTSDCCSLLPGFRFELIKHEHADYNAQYVVVAMKTEAVQSPGYISDEPVTDPYSVSLVALSYGKADSAPFRPIRQTPKPVVHGSQSAVVVGPAGEEIFTDKYGRVKVQFNWDRDGRKDARSSCWLRVAQMWAGKKWGTMFIPRIGMEVLVDFLEGDPDQPIIVGCVYNADNMPPYTLPDNKTRSTIKTNSSPGGNGFNEIRFEDKKGEEQIFIHAQKNQDIRVEKDNMEWIGKDRHLIVEENQYEKVKKDKHLQVIGDQVEKVDGNVHLNVRSNKEQKIGSKFAVDSGNEIHLKAGMSVTIEAGTQVTLKAGGSFVNIGPSGVSIKGAMVMINSGGAAGSGGGASPGSPKDPKEADKDESGQVAKTPPPPPPPVPPKFAALASVVRQQTSSAEPPASAAAEGPDQLRAVLMEILPEAIPQHDAILEAMSPATLDKIKRKIAALGPPSFPNPFDEVRDAGALDQIANAVEPAMVLSEDLAANIQAYAEEAAQRAQAAREAAIAQMERAHGAASDAKDVAAAYADEIAGQVEEAKQVAAAYSDEVAGQVEEAKQVAAAYTDEVAQQAEEAKKVAATYADEAERQAEEVKQIAAAYSDEVSNAASGISEQGAQALQSARNAVPFM